MMRILAAFAGLLFLAACGGDAHMDEVHDLMSDVMEPAADGIWDRAGWIMTEEGEEELWPTTDEGWQEVAASAQKLAETAEQLKQPPYANGEANWNEIADGLVTAANRARQAAENQDKEELFDAGGHIYRVCVACHERYMIEDHEAMEEAGG